MRQSWMPFVALILVVAPAAAQVTITEPSTLAALVGEIDRNNPELKAARRDIDMRLKAASLQQGTGYL